MGPQINVQIHGGKVNNLNISPISMVGNNSAFGGSNVSHANHHHQARPFILSDNYHSNPSQNVNQPQLMI